VIEAALVRLRHGLSAVRALAAPTVPDQATWRPSADAWCLVEVVNHLYDEEREDFRARLDLTLHHPDEPFPAIDPAGWVTARGYAARDLAESIGRFAAERERSLAWLATLGDADWRAEHATPGGHVLRAGDLLVSWVAHDHLHLRQLNELQYAYTAAAAASFGVGYAGDW
jgi:hypothetical protein